MTASPAALLAELRRSPGGALVVLGLMVALALTPAIFAPGLYDDFTLAKQAALLLAASTILAGLALGGEFLPRQPAVRWLLLAWTVLLVVSFASGIDRRGSVLGYYQYRQGFLTQIAYIAVFLGALNIARRGDFGRLGRAGVVGLAAVTLYTAVQAVGLDPIDWWIDTSARAIGTIGNANELAAYAVIALAFCAFMDGRSPRVSALLTAGVAACSAFIVLESESRSGLLALAVVFITFPLGSVVVRQRWRDWTRRWLVLLAGLLLGATLSFLAGGAAGTASRVQTGFTQETSGSTRVELWKGTLSTIAASPLLGFGPDGLHLAFPRERPADLGGAFLDYDLVAQSSHNAALDIAANQGLPALLAIAGLLAVVASRSLRHERSEMDAGIPFAWAAMTGYVALTMVNPVSLAPHALFFVLAGALQGRTEQQLPAPRRTQLPAPARLALVSPAVLTLAAIAILLPLADLSANRAWEHFADGDFAAAAADYETARGLLPTERTYATAVAESWLAAGVEGGPPALQHAVATYESFDADFGFASGEAIGLVTARIGLGETTALGPLIDRALRLNPHGVSMAAYAVTLRSAAAGGGTIHYSEKDHWVFVVPGPASPP